MGPTMRLLGLALPIWPCMPMQANRGQHAAEEERDHPGCSGEWHVHYFSHTGLELGQQGAHHGTQRVAHCAWRHHGRLQTSGEGLRQSMLLRMLLRTHPQASPHASLLLKLSRGCGSARSYACSYSSSSIPPAAAVGKGLRYCSQACSYSSSYSCASIPPCITPGLAAQLTPRLHLPNCDKLTVRLRVPLRPQLGSDFAFLSYSPRSRLVSGARQSAEARWTTAHSERRDSQQRQGWGSSREGL